MRLQEIVTFSGKIHCLTGLCIGGSSNALEIGGIDHEVIKNPLTKEPYIPGSSLKGKMRSELEKKYGTRKWDKKLKRLVPAPDDPCHCGKKTCPICVIFGAYKNPKAHSAPTRIIVRDSPLSNESRDIINNLPISHGSYLERKTENIILRNYGTAGSPRTIERVPAGISFTLEIILRIFEKDNKEDLIKKVQESLKLVKKSYLGGSGSRGYGQVAFEYEITCEPIQEPQK